MLSTLEGYEFPILVENLTQDSNSRIDPDSFENISFKYIKLDILISIFSYNVDRMNTQIYLVLELSAKLSDIIIWVPRKLCNQRYKFTKYQSRILAIKL